MQPRPNHKWKKGQHIIEYILLVVVTVVIALAFTSRNSRYHEAVENVLEMTVNQVDKLTEEIRFAP